MAKSHSKYTWADLQKEAYGEMGLHPWELDDYSMQDFFFKRSGLYDRELREWHMVRFLAYYAAGSDLKKGTKLKDILPLPGDTEHTTESLKERYQRQREKLKAAGLL